MKPSILIAALLLAGLSAYIMWFDTEPSSDEEPQRVFELGEERIVELELLQPDAEPIRLVEKDGLWHMTQPMVDLADRHEVDVLLRHLETLPLERIVTPTSSAGLEDFGLSPPQLEVRFRTASGLGEGIAFGADTPTGTGQFARRWHPDDETGDTILIVPPYQTTTLRRGTWELRDMRLFRIDDALEPQSVSIESDSGTTLLERQRGRWVLTAPIRSNADRIAAADLVSAWTTARIEKTLFPPVPGENDAYGLEEPSYELRFGFDGMSDAVVKIGEKLPDEDVFYARTPPRQDVLTLSGTLVARLDVDPLQLASKKLFHFSAYDVRRLEIVRSGQPPRVIERLESSDEGGEPQLQDISNGERPQSVDSTAFQQLLYKLNSTEASSVKRATGGNENGIDTPPATTIKVWSPHQEDQEDQEILTIGSPLGSNVYARRAGDDVSLLLTLEQWQSIDELLSLEPALPN